MESFNSRFWDEFLNIELFTSVQEAKLLANSTESVSYRHLTLPTNREV